jgi:hypothetical protein
MRQFPASEFKRVIEEWMAEDVPQIDDTVPAETVFRRTIIEYGEYWAVGWTFDDNGATRWFGPAHRRISKPDARQPGEERF